MIPDSLENLSRQLRGRVLSCEHFSPNVGEWAHHEMRARLRGYRVGARLTESRVEVEVKGLDSQVSFSINAPDRVCLLKRPLGSSLVSLPHPVFVAATSSEATVAWLREPENAVLLTDFRLTERESLQVYRNAVVLIGEVERATEDTVERLCDLADRICDRVRGDLVDGLEFSVDRLPPGLQPLAGLVRRFAIGDDTLRGDLTREASAAGLVQVRAQVLPLLPEINAFLDSFGGRPLSNEATLIGRLAEAAIELGSREV